MKSLVALLGLAATSACAQNLAPAWTVTTPKDAPAVLSFDGADGVRAHFQCLRKSGQVSLDFEVGHRIADHKVGEVWVDASSIAAPWPVSIVFAAGAYATTLRGQAEPTETASTTRVKTEIATAAPVIKAFAKSGAISFRVLNSAVSPGIAKPSGVRKFLAVCK